MKRLATTILLLAATLNSTAPATEGSPAAIQAVYSDELTPEQAMEALLNYELPSDIGYHVQDYAKNIRFFALTAKFIQAKDEKAIHECMDKCMQLGEYKLLSLIKGYELAERYREAGRLNEEEYSEYYEAFKAMARESPQAHSLLCGMIQIHPNLSAEEKTKRTRELVLEGTNINHELPLTNAAITLLYQQYGDIDVELAQQLLKKALYQGACTLAGFTSEQSLWEAIARICELKGEAFRPLQYGALICAFRTAKEEEEKGEIAYKLACFCEQMPADTSFPRESFIHHYLAQAALTQHPEALIRLNELAQDPNSKASTDKQPKQVRRSSVSSGLMSPYRLSSTRERLVGIDLLLLLNKAIQGISEERLEEARQSQLWGPMLHMLQWAKMLAETSSPKLADSETPLYEQQKLFWQDHLRRELFSSQFFNDASKRYSIYKYGVGTTRAGQSEMQARSFLLEQADKGNIQFIVDLMLERLKDDPEDYESLQILAEAFSLGSLDAADFFCKAALNGTYGLKYDSASQNALIGRAQAALAKTAWQEALKTANTQEERLVALYSLAMSGSCYSRLDAELMQYATTHPETADVVECIRLLFAYSSRRDDSYPADYAACSTMQNLLAQRPELPGDKGKAEFFIRILENDKSTQKYLFLQTLKYDVDRTGALDEVRKGAAACILMQAGNIIHRQSALSAEELLAWIAQQPGNVTSDATLVITELNAETAQLAIQAEVSSVLALSITPEAAELLQQLNIAAVSPEDIESGK